MHGPGGFGGPGFGGPGPGGPLGGLLLGLGIGAAGAAAVGAMDRPPPPPGYVVMQGGVQRVPQPQAFLIKAVAVTAAERRPDNEDYFRVSVTAADGVQFDVLRRYNWFEELNDGTRRQRRQRAYVAFPKKKFTLFRRLNPEELEELRLGLHVWLEELHAAAVQQESLRGPLYTLVDFHKSYQRIAEQLGRASGAVAAAQGGGSLGGGGGGAAATRANVASAEMVTATPVYEGYEEGGAAAAAAAAAAAGDDVPWALEGERTAAARVLAQYGPGGGGRLGGAAARAALLATKAPAAQLREVWELADLDRDGQLDLDELTVALHLCADVTSGRSLPATLPWALVPPSKRSGSQPVGANPFI